MTGIPDTLFDPDLLKKAVLTDRQADVRTSKKSCVQNSKRGN